MRWMFWEQYSHEPYIAVARFIKKFLPQNDARTSELPRLHERGNQALSLLEKHLATNPYLVSDAYTIADIALYAYTHCAEEGGFVLRDYPSIVDWIDRVESQSGYIPMA